MAIIDMFGGALNTSFNLTMRVLGWTLSLGLYLLLAVHTYAYFTVIAWLLKKRFGTAFGLLWTGIGLSLLYNIIFNHFLAMVIKPGGPRDLEKIE